MIISYQCETDKVDYRVSKMDPQLHLLGVVLPCPTCRTPMTITEAKIDFAVKDVWSIKRISALELFQASNGLGFKSEQDAASLGKISQCVGAKIKSISMEEVGPRVIVNSITVEDNTGLHVLHFGTSTKGAVIYKVVQEK